MTNYMELLMTNQPWNLILFMVIPVGLAEGLVATEFYKLYLKEEAIDIWRGLNKILGILVGFYFTGVFLYLVTHVVPNIEWRGWVDVVAVGAYLCGVVPLLSIALMEVGIIFKNLSQRQKMHRHFLFLILFLVVSHVAMIFGMVDPSIIGAGESQATHQHENHMHSHSMHMSN